MQPFMTKKYTALRIDILMHNHARHCLESAKKNMQFFNMNIWAKASKISFVIAFQSTRWPRSLDNMIVDMTRKKEYWNIKNTYKKRLKIKSCKISESIAKHQPLGGISLFRFHTNNDSTNFRKRWPYSLGGAQLMKRRSKIIPFRSLSKRFRKL